jgi:hypothetical protein
MSIRLLYQRIPARQRLCSYYRCKEPVLRNIDRDKQGRIYHHGCLLSAQEEQFHCLDCFSHFDATEAHFQEGQRCYNDLVSTVLKPVCPNCGSPNLKR